LKVMPDTPRPSGRVFCMGRGNENGAPSPRLARRLPVPQNGHVPGRCPRSETCHANSKIECSAASSCAPRSDRACARLRTEICAKLTTVANFKALETRLPVGEVASRPVGELGSQLARRQAPSRDRLRNITWGRAFGGHMHMPDRSSRLSHYFVTARERPETSGNVDVARTVEIAGRERREPAPGHTQPERGLGGNGAQAMTLEGYIVGQGSG
jgi:hypothetical protein